MQLSNMSKLYVFFQEVKVVFTVMLQIIVPMEIHGAEALSAAGKVFVAVEPTFTINPHIGRATRFQRCTMFTAAMATVGLSVLTAEPREIGTSRIPV